MGIAIEEIQAKSALTGSGAHYRLNPYVGCEHACVYCYATYLGRWRHQTKPWGSWLLVKTNLPRVLERELRRKQNIEVFLSTACDAYQPAEEKYCLTRQCLRVLALAAQHPEGPRVFVLTKSARIWRDVEILQAFPRGRIKVAFSLTTPRDEVARVLEPYSSPPSQRFAIMAALNKAGIPAGMLINPVLPYITERDLPELLDQAEAAGCAFVGFDMLHYLNRHISQKMERAYRFLGAEAQKRLQEARYNAQYEPQVRAYIEQALAGRHFGNREKT